MAFLSINAPSGQRNDDALTHFCGGGGENAVFSHCIDRSFCNGRVLGTRQAKTIS
jgi:hypothetical protein